MWSLASFDHRWTQLQRNIDLEPAPRACRVSELLFHAGLNAEACTARPVLPSIFSASWYAIGKCMVRSSTRDRLNCQARAR